ncbi:MAG: family 78 glycoside hydrolase catalytic domain, partial [Caldilineaceae bacterium]|nr:family 78 glycoside hydrolase catalytic domain [Caldilineaceae bacterium]
MSAAQEIAGAGTAVTDLRCEYAVNPLGIGVRRPRLSWRLLSSRRGAAQVACQIRVASSIDALGDDAALLWDSGRLDSSESLHHCYGGPEPASGARCFWQVRVWDERGVVSAWSAPGWWELGLLEPADWTAQWIAPGWVEDPAVPQPSPLLRREFAIAKPVARARLYVTAHGLYRCEINGRRVGDALLTPGWTSYHHRLLVQSYDVTALMREGDNALGAMLGEGWYRGRIGAVGGLRCAYGERLALLAQLVIEHADGTRTTVGSDAAWQAATGPILASGIYDGEIYDARLERDGWSQPGAGAEWEPVQVAAQPLDNLRAWSGPYVRRMEEVAPVAVAQRADTRFIYDFGQNIAGWTRLAVRGAAGTVVTLRHAEV